MWDTKGKKYYEKYLKALNFHQDKFDSYTELAAYYELEQNNLKSMSNKPWVYQINTPFATDAVNMRVASLQSSDYSGELEPLSPEDVNNVKLLNDVYRERWNEMNMDSVINDAILQSAVIGEAYAHIIFDSEVVSGGTGRKNKGGISSYFIDAASVHLDPKALSLKTADYVCVSERATKSEIKRDYPDFSFADFNSDSDPQKRGEIYLGTSYTNEQDRDVYTKVTIYEKTKKGIERTVLLEQKILEDTKVMEVKYIPIAQMVWQKKLKSPYGTSLLSQLLPLQKVLNEIASASANANMQYSSPSFAISEDSGIDPERFAASAGAPGVVAVISSGIRVSDAIQPLLPNRGIDQGLILSQQELERNIYKLAGINGAFQGETGTVGNTSTGADLAMQRAKIIEQRVLTNIEEFVEDLTRIIVSFITEGFAGETLYSRGERQSNNQFQFKEFNVPENARDLEFGFYIELSVRTQYSKEQQKKEMVELYQFERQYDDNTVKAINTLDVLKTLDMPQRGEIISRYERAVQQDNEQKAQIVTEIVLTAQQYNIDPQMTNAAVADILSNSAETPSLDQFMMMAEQARMQQEQMEATITGAQSTQAYNKLLEEDEALNDAEITQN